LSYATGEGVTQNNLRAYVWFSVAAAQGDRQAKLARETAYSQLTAQGLEQAQALATSCFESNFKDCGE